MTPTVTMREALADPALLGSVLADDTWNVWRVLLIAAMGEELTDQERETFAAVTGREREPGQRVDEFAAVVGRRGGKSRAMSTLAAYVAGLCDHSDVLAPGERGICLAIAPDQRQALITIDYTDAAFAASPIMRQLVANRTSDAIELVSGIRIEVRAASFRRLRGPTYIAVLADEAAFWYADDSANADAEILGACRPGLATTQGPLFIASSPYGRAGELWSLHRAHYGPEGDPRILVAQGASRTFNPALPQAVVDRALERDPASARAEYLGLFRDDIEQFVSRAEVEACVTSGVGERAPQPGVRYCGFCDPSGGGADSMTLAIGHKEGEATVLDAVREVKPPFSPEAVTEEFATLLRRYSVSAIQGDKYAAAWTREAFQRHGISFNQAAKPKSDLYRDLLPRIRAGEVDMLDHGKLVNQLVGLERRVSRGGRDSIDHRPGAHDDLANVLAGLVAVTAGPLHIGEAWTGSIMPDGAIVEHEERRRTGVRVRKITQAEYWKGL